MLRCLIILAIGLASPLAMAQSDLVQQAKEFHARYVALGDAFDVAVADLYADDAAITTARRYPHGLERAISIGGAQWKALVRAAMPLAKVRDDRSEFSQVEFVEADGRVRITAQRRSLSKCYTDAGYFMVVAPQADGSLKIVEEHTETQPQSSC